MSCLHDTRTVAILVRIKPLGGSVLGCGPVFGQMLNLHCEQETKSHPKSSTESCQAEVPMEWVHLDILLPFTESQKGNK